MATHINVRAPRTSEFEAWLDLWRGYNAFYERVGPAAVPDAVTRATWERFFRPAEPVHALVAEADGRLVGLVHYIFHRNTAMLGPVCYLQDLYTDESARGRGVGRALIEAATARARAAGAERVYWHTHETNTTAMRLYDRLAQDSGFVVYRKAVAAAS